MKLKETAWANASAISVGVVYLVCAAFVAILPGLSKLVMQSWFHGINFENLWTGAARGNFVLGLISAVIGAWLVGYLFAGLYNKLGKGK
ncbi:MAG: DUF5676 family membrane protein [Patescibacteria group bacterium]